MATVVKAMAQPDSGLEIRDRMWLKITIPNAFIGWSHYMYYVVLDNTCTHRWNAYVSMEFRIKQRIIMPAIRNLDIEILPC